jgi:hypothetical protein
MIQYKKHNWRDKQNMFNLEKRIERRYIKLMFVLKENNFRQGRKIRPRKRCKMLSFEKVLKS